MSFLAQNIALEKYFTDSWTYTPIAYANARFNPNNLAEWVRISNLPGRSDRISISSRVEYRHFGILTIQIFTKLNIGSGRAWELADNASQLFTTTNVDNTHFYVPDIRVINNNDGQWFQLNVDCEYYRDDFGVNIFLIEDGTRLTFEDGSPFELES